MPSSSDRDSIQLSRSMRLSLPADTSSPASATPSTAWLTEAVSHARHQRRHGHVLAFIECNAIIGAEGDEGVEGDAASHASPALGQRRRRDGAVLQVQADASQLTSKATFISRYMSQSDANIKWSARARHALSIFRKTPSGILATIMNRMHMHPQKQHLLCSSAGIGTRRSSKTSTT